MSPRARRAISPARSMSGARRARAEFPCAVCGSALTREPRGRSHGRAALQIVCPRCRFRVYDYPRVCVGVVVLRGGDVLVLTRGHEPRRGALDLPGGFLEADEDLEFAARRELYEETGLRVGRASMIGLYWDRYVLPGFGPVPTLNLYFVARWRAGVPRAADDAADAHWMPLGSLTHASIARRFAWRHMRQLLRDVRRSGRTLLSGTDSVARRLRARP